jgi:predicted ATPase
MISKFKCTNYKQLILPEDGLKFKRVNLFIGSNNSGKTNLLEAISFFSDVVKYGASNALGKRSFSNILNKYSDTKKVSFEMEFNDNVTQDSASPMELLSLKYDTEIQFTESNGYYFSQEILSNEKPRSTKFPKPFEYFTFTSTNPASSYGYCSFQDPKKHHTSKSLTIQSPETFFRQTELIMGQLNKGKDRDGFLDNLNPTIKNVRAYLDGWFHYNMARISIKEVVKPSKMTQSDTYLSLDGTNFQNLMRLFHDDHRIEQIEAFLKEENILPKLVRMYTPTIQAENTVTEFSIDNKIFKLSELSDGTIRLLLLLLITKFQKTPTVFLDEPESNLHPAWLAKVYKMVDESTNQLFISTHSADLLDKFTNDFMADKINIFVVEEGSITLLNQHRDIIAERIEEGWELGDLYRVGDTLIGGWPW